MLIVIASIIVSLVVGALIFLNLPRFGRLPSGERLARIEKSANYCQGEFQNLIETPTLENGQGLFSATLEYLFTKKERLVPEKPVPSVETDFKQLDKNRDLIVWLGHSSYYLQLGGRTFLIDPVFSDFAAPVSFANRAFPGSNPFAASDFPEIDYLLITHDHWDHLDYPTVMNLKIKQIVTALGVGAHCQRWGFSDKFFKGAAGIA